MGTGVPPGGQSIQEVQSLPKHIDKVSPEFQECPRLGEEGGRGPAISRLCSERKLPGPLPRWKGSREDYPERVPLRGAEHRCDSKGGTGPPEARDLLPAQLLTQPMTWVKAFSFHEPQ